MMSRRMGLAMACSVLVHGALGFGYFYSRNPAPKTAQVVPLFKTEVLTESELDALMRRHRRVVKNDAEPEDSKSLPKKKFKDEAEYSSDRSVRVEKETVARGEPGFGISGRTGLRINLGMESVTTESENGASTRASGILQNPGLRGGSIDVLSSEVVVGAQTLLNTDEYKYASFFNRMKSDIEPRWRPRINQITRADWQKIPEGSYLTEVSIGTDARGKVTWVEIKRSCGFASFDQAAVDSIWELSFLNNLPKDLLDREQRYRTSFSFVVQITKKGLMFDTRTENEENRWR